MTRPAVVCAVLALNAAACVASPSAGPRTVTVANILEGAAGPDGTTVVLEGEYRGWRPDPGGPAARQGPPVTRSDWALDDGTGSIYVTGAASGLDPTRDIGKRIRVTGALRQTQKGQPYVQATVTERP